jgi:hypothetical protein
MRNKCLILVLALVSLPSLGVAQEDPGNLVVPLADGGFVAFKSETASIRTTKTSSAFEKLQAEFRTQAFIDENHVIHRVLVDAAGKYLFAYDLMIKPVPASKTFTIGVSPLDSELEKKLLARNSDGRSSSPIATLPRSAEPQILDDGDSFALDLLVNQKTGVKIVDRVKVSFNRSNLGNDGPKALPRDFTLDAVALKVVDFKLLVDGNLVAESKHGRNFAGALIWCYIEGDGRFILSLVPRESYEFRKVGIITDNKIEFTVKGKHYEWFSSEPILPGGGAWNLWVLHDPKYLPFGSQQISRQEKGRLDKLDDSVKAAQERAARIGDPSPNTFRKKTDAPQSEVQPQRFRVMVGAADRIENLWPK